MYPLTSMLVNEYIYAHSFSKMTSSQVLKECLDEIINLKYRQIQLKFWRQFEF